MKKNIGILLAILIAVFSLNGCNKGDEAIEKSAAGDVTSDATDPEVAAPEVDSPEAPPQIDTSKLLSNSYVQLFQSQRYLLKFKGIVDLDPEDIFSNVTFAVEGDNVLWTIEAEGSKSHIITKGNTAFMLDEASKSYATGTVSNMETSLVDGDSLVYSSKGEEIIHGMKMIYEEYDYDIGKLKFFFNKKDDKKLYAILNTNPVETVMMEIIEFSENVTPDMFEIPEGYKGI